METRTMGVYFAGNSRSAEDQIWEHVDRMRDAGPIADSYLAALERRKWAIGTGHSASSGTGISVATAMACRRWIGIRLIAVGHWFGGTSPVQSVDDGFMITQGRMAS
jgi:hypothetical protein